MRKMDNDNSEILKVRLELAGDRLREIEEEGLAMAPVFGDYFKKVAGFALMLLEELEFVQGQNREADSRGSFDWSASLEELARRNAAMYADIVPGNYDTSYANPAYAVRMLAPEAKLRTGSGAREDNMGTLLAAIYREVRAMITYAYLEDVEQVLIRAELIIEVFAAFEGELKDTGHIPDYGTIKDIFYWFVSDYSDISMESSIRSMLVPGEGLACDVIRKADLSDARYIYRYGEFIGDNERMTAEFIASLPQDTINRIADTYTEGYRIGFEVTGKDISIKKSGGIYMTVGFERVMRRALENFAAMGLDMCINDHYVSLLTVPYGGLAGGAANRQYSYDHRDDIALILDRNLLNRKLDVMKAVYETLKEEAGWYGGPAVLETFGEHSFDPVNKSENAAVKEDQKALVRDLRNKSSEILRKYVRYEERSFTIMAMPVPEISEDPLVFREIFMETVKLNTLDYCLYRDIQATIIDALDKGEYCEIRGMNGNTTNLVVNLWKLKDPEKETIFENCVADVNIPVGEVFTSPVLKGTNGILNVSRVFLSGMEYRDLTLRFVDGMIRDYSCSNFATREENRALIEDAILFRHPTLPMGEFAIGTNTLAYTMARKYGIEAKMPILIAEKTGPHFAVGDTCYSYEEDLVTYNPNGKSIVARENEISRLRGTDPERAYFNCHTDITIPYDELGEITCVTAAGERISIIKDGRFVLPGTEKLNEALVFSEY